MEEKSPIKYHIIKLGVFFILSVLIFIFRNQLIDNINYFIGGLILLYGIEEILFRLIYSRNRFFHSIKVFLGFVEILLGALLLIANKIAYEHICIIWAVWSIMREAIEIEEIFNEYKHWIPRIISGIESLTAIALSIMLILEPGHHHALIHLYLLLFELILSPLTPLLEELLDKRKKKSEDK